MKSIFTKLVVALVAMRSIDSALNLECYKGYKYTLDGGVENQKEFELKHCGMYDRCFSVKGSFILDGRDFEVIEIRGCFDQSSCKTYAENVEAKTYYLDLKKNLFVRLNIHHDKSVPAREGATLSDIKCCEGQGCNNDDFSIAKPTEPAGENSSRGGKFSLIVGLACFLFKFFTQLF